ncbi:Ankyrin repeats (3 copies) [Thalassoglobus neptunius]|uniref:Ankyrin repeats (3 copies) n=1 Tax=Thalassoglobus neptunius TaxID=1938619 RepID=A0A5C5WYH9_9PLAN|nr:ankyrin repeat domain-containing protein [Thalassoglobus neptunius]TWT55747.1 Ankyrin repeats (3 copies) [Thalassoglobus neptunius]
MTNTQLVFELIDAGDLDVLRSLIAADPAVVFVRHADANLFHWTTLQYAASEGKLDVCRLLVEQGAEVYTNPMNSYPPVIQAVWKKHQDVVDYFLKEIPHLAEGTNGTGVALNLAAREGWTEIVDLHLKKDPLSVFQRGWIGDTPLHWPAHNNHGEIVQKLIAAGADIEADEINCYGGKPLHWASEHAPESVRRLLAAGANVNSRNIKEDSDFFGVTPLIMNATQRDDCDEVTQLLLQAGADPSLIDAQGKTALDHARERGLAKITKVLESWRS